MACLAEQKDADDPEGEEWRYYHRDGNSLVRQTSNTQAEVTLTWTYSPEGGVLLGEEGPVTNLGCTGNATYDFSTGLIFKNGNYFDPNTGIWITLGGVFVWRAQQQSRRRNRRLGKKKRRLLLILLFLLLVMTLAGCGGGSSTNGDPTATPCPTYTPIPSHPPTDTPLPPPVLVNPSPGPPPQPTPPQTVAPIPTITPTPTVVDPLVGFELSNPLKEDYYWICEFGAAYCGEPFGNHNGLDIFGINYIAQSCGATGCSDVNSPPPPASREYRKVYSPVTGKIKETFDSRATIYNIRHNETGEIINDLEIDLTHIDTSPPIFAKDTDVNSGDFLTYYVGDPSFPYPHLHIAVRYKGIPENPEKWLKSGNIGYYFSNYNHQTMPEGL